MVVYVFNPSYRGGRSRRIEFEASPGKVNETISKTRIQAWHWWLVPVILATQKAEIRRIEI
jgi:hypothetical protein